MNKKMLFIDVDGTLSGVDPLTGKQYIPQSAIDGIRKVRKAGHLVFLCTGRSKKDLENIMSIGFDGVVGASGAYAMYEDQMLYHHPMDEKDVDDVLSYFDDNQCGYFIETNEGIFVNDLYKDFMMNKDVDDDFKKIIHSVDNRGHVPVNKMTFFSLSKTLNEIIHHFDDRFTIIPASYPGLGENAGELSAKGLSKATAIKYLVDYLHMDMKDTYGFGDGMNDLEMFSVVEVSIAMENGKDEVKKNANFITKPYYEDGLDYAFKYFKLY